MTLITAWAVALLIVPWIKKSLDEERVYLYTGGVIYWVATIIYTGVLFIQHVAIS